MVGIEAVIDKDRASALLAKEIKADMLLLLTDVDAVYKGYGTSTARAIAQVGAQEISADQFPDGSMGPKIQAATRFVLETGNPAAIGRLEDAMALLAGSAGTRIEAGSLKAQYRG